MTAERREKIHEYPSDNVVIRFHAARCIHAGECVRGLPDVFDPKARPWVQPEEAAAERVCRVVERCPTGALTYERRDGGPVEAFPDGNSARLEADGPIYLRGDLMVLDADGEEVGRCHRLALCRCGASANKPFCDGRHAKAGFAAASDVGQAKARPPRDDDRTLRVRPLADGPVMLEGPFEIHDGDGAVIFESGRAALCRCGASENKPFCDGAHKGVGFTG